MIKALAALVIGALALLVPLSSSTGTLGAASHRATVHAKRGAVSASLTDSSDDWPMFQGNPDHTGVSPDTSISASSAGNLVERWATYDGGHGKGGIIASPTVVYNSTLNETLIYDSSDIGNIEAIDAATGAVVWSDKTDNSTYGSPTYYDGVLYVVTNNGYLETFDATTGAADCSTVLPLSAEETAPGRIMDSPVVGEINDSGPMVFFGDAGDNSTGEELNGGHEWAFTGVGNTAGGCKEVWMFNDWLLKAPKPDENETGSWSPPALTQDADGNWLLVFGSSNPDDQVYALDAATGEKDWSVVTTVEHDDDVGAGPAITAPGVNGIADGAVYIDGKNSILYAIDLTTGATLGQFNMKALVGAAINSVSTPSVADGKVFVAYGAYFFAFDALDLNAGPIWQAGPLTYQDFSSSAISGPPGDQVVFIGDLAGTEYGFDIATGVQEFEANIRHQIWASTTIADNMVLFAGMNGELYCYSIPASTSTAINATPNPVAKKSNVIYSANVTPVPDAGTVSFTTGTGKPIPRCTDMPVDTTTGRATCQTSYLTAGDYSVAASYNGDTAFLASTATTYTEVVARGTATYISASANPIHINKAVTYVARIDPPAAGTVDFTQDGTTIAGCGAVAVDTTNGKATCRVDGYSDPGTHAIVASYSGTTDYSASVSKTLSEVVNGVCGDITELITRIGAC